VPGSRIRIEGVGLNPLRTGLFLTLREMGAALTVGNERVEGGEPVGDIEVAASSLRAVDVPAARAPSMIDEYPVLAVACAYAGGTSRLRGLGELRVKESDRLAATAALLAGNGVDVAIEGDDLMVTGAGGPPPGGGTVVTHMDHRLAMSGLVLGAGARAAVSVDEVAFIDTSFPGFAALMTGLGCRFA
jgi:3-phosphoshikimate 1-carboxyvinyltransferase